MNRQKRDKKMSAIIEIKNITKEFKVLNRRDDIAKLNEETERTQSRIECLKAEIGRSGTRAEALSRYCRVERLDYVVVSEFINNVYVDAKQPDGSREIRIEWNF